MSIRSFLYVKCLFIAFITSSNATQLSKENYKLIDLSSLNMSKKVDLITTQRKHVFDYLGEKYGDWWDYKIIDALQAPLVDRAFVKVEMYLKDEKTKEFVIRQSQLLKSGRSKEQTQHNKMIVLEFDKVYELPIAIDHKNKGLAFQFSNCLSEGVLASIDLNKDDVYELIVLKGYESTHNDYGATYNHYRLYLLSDKLLFDDWLQNQDYENLQIGEKKQPKITGLNNGNEGIFSVLYDKDNVLVKSDRLGLIRKNSLFVFNNTNDQSKTGNKQLVVVWSKIYRPPINYVKGAKGKDGKFEFSEEHFELFEGNIETKGAFVKKTVPEKMTKVFLSSYGLSFDDGLTMDRLCGYD